jgi:hypothetical protein
LTFVGPPAALRPAGSLTINAPFELPAQHLDGARGVNDEPDGAVALRRRRLGLDDDALAGRGDEDQLFAGDAGDDEGHVQHVGLELDHLDRGRQRPEGATAPRPSTSRLCGRPVRRVVYLNHPWSEGPTAVGGVAFLGMDIPSALRDVLKAGTLLDISSDDASFSLAVPITDARPAPDRSAILTLASPAGDGSLVISSAAIDAATGDENAYEIELGALYVTPSNHPNWT